MRLPKRWLFLASPRCMKKIPALAATATSLIPMSIACVRLRARPAWPMRSRRWRNSLYVSRAARRSVPLPKKIHHEPFETEIPMEVWDDVSPAPALSQINERKLAVVTTSGVVPWGNPDRFKTYRNTHWQKYNIAEVKELEPGKWEAVHGGYNVAYMNKNPHYGVPLDALRSLEAEGKIGRGKLYPAYYVIPGNQGSPAVMRRVGQEIGSDLKNEGVEGVLFVAT